MPAGVRAGVAFAGGLARRIGLLRRNVANLTVTLGSTTLATYSNLNKAAGYVQHSFNVSGFAGQTLTLTFKGVEDSSLQTSFVSDDTALNVS